MLAKVKSKKLFMAQGAPKGNTFAKGSNGGGYNAVIRQLVGLCSKEALILGKKQKKTPEEQKLWNEILLAVVKKAVPTTIEGSGDKGQIVVEITADKYATILRREFNKLD